MSEWRETPQNIVAMLAGCEKGEGNPQFDAYCAVATSLVMQREVERILCTQLHVRDRGALFKLNHRSKKYRAAMVRAGEAAEERLPRYFAKVRQLLCSHFRDWLHFRKDTFSFMRARPDLKDKIDKLLEASRPYLRLNRQSFGAEIDFPNVAASTVTGTAPGSEAARLFLKVLTWKDAKLIEGIKQCEGSWHARGCRQVCGNIFIGQGSRQKFCSRACFLKTRADTENFRSERKRYMEKRREEDAEQIINWAAKSKATGKELADSLNKQLPTKNRTIERVGINWVTRHWKEIEKRRRKYAE